MKFKVGDKVRILLPPESKGWFYKFVNIIKTHNPICTIVEIEEDAVIVDVPNYSTSVHLLISILEHSKHKEFKEQLKSILEERQNV